MNGLRWHNGADVAVGKEILIRFKRSDETICWRLILWFSLCWDLKTAEPKYKY